MKNGTKFTRIAGITTFFSLFLFAIASRSAAQNYCIPADTAVRADHGINTILTAMAFVNFNNANSGFSTGGYIDYMSESVLVNQADSFLLQGAALGGHPMHWAAWIDWNRDGDFDDSGELVYQDNINFTSTFSSLIGVPATVDTGLSRMRIMALYSGNATNPCDTNMDGEVEDYAIIIMAGSTGIRSATFNSSAVKVFPNPATGQVTIQAAEQRLEAVSIINVLGQRLRHYEPKGQSQVTLGVAELPAGIYRLLVQTAEGSTSQRLEIF